MGVLIHLCKSWIFPEQRDETFQLCCSETLNIGFRQLSRLAKHVMIIFDTAAADISLTVWVNKFKTSAQNISAWCFLSFICLFVCFAFFTLKSTPRNNDISF